MFTEKLKCSCISAKTDPQLDLELSPKNVDSVSEWLKRNYEYQRSPFSDVPYRLKLRKVYENYLEAFRNNTISIKIFSKIIIGTFQPTHTKAENNTNKKEYKLLRLADGMYIPHLIHKNLMNNNE